MKGDMIATREAFSKAIVEFGAKDERVVVLDADLSHATMSCRFAEAVPERFFNAGISEADMVDMAAGLSLTGKIPFACTFAVFSAGRAFEQIRNTIAYPKLNVKICGSHGGLAVGPDGATHQAIEDFAIMNSLPNMTVLNPGDAVEMRAAVKAMIDYEGPVYLRMGRSPVPIVLDEETYTFEIGKGTVMRQGDAVTLAATGSMLDVALKAAEALAAEKIEAEVLNLPTIKPLDKELVLSSVKKTGRIVVLEEGVILGGLSSSIAVALAETNPVPMRFVAINDCFGQSGDPAVLLKHYGLSVKNTVAKAKELL